MKTSHTPHIGQTTVTERWDGTRWVERTLYWNGEAYVSERVQPAPALNAHVHEVFRQALNGWACIGNGLYVRTQRGR